MTRINPTDPAAEAPRPRRATLKGGPAAPGSPPLAAGGKTLRPEGSPTPLRGAASTSAPRSRERAVVRTPGPETRAASPLHGAAQVRARVKTPAGAVTPREGAAPAGSRGLSGAEWRAAAAKASRRRPAKAAPRAEAGPTIPPPGGGAALTATARCLRGCDWTAGPGDPAEIDKAAERHTTRAPKHPTNLMSEVTA